MHSGRRLLFKLELQRLGAQGLGLRPAAGICNGKDKWHQSEKPFRGILRCSHVGRGWENKVGSESMAVGHRAKAPEKAQKSQKKREERTLEGRSMECPKPNHKTATDSMEAQRIR